MSAADQLVTMPTSIREAIMYTFTRNARLGDPVLSDETAFMIMGILDDLWLWFNTVYGEQARCYRPPETGDPDDNLWNRADDHV
jgi:hypothetical protein